jgi:5-methyltetrahydrofolate--homocysteine methyltransferase
MAVTLAELLTQRSPIIYDGATGTFLQEMGLPLRSAPENWVLERPANVFAAASAYVNAGAQIILTCTFGGTAIRLLEAGLDAQAYEINRRAAQLAKQAAEGRALVAGSIGPIGQLPLVLGTLTYKEAVGQFSDQARALADGGVDLFSIESMSDLVEMKAAIEGTMRGADLPIFATLSFDTNGKTLTGITPTLAAHELMDARVAAIGANCGKGPEDVAAILQEMHAAARDATLIAKPNAGIPEVRTGWVNYPIPPARFAMFAHDWVRAGARIIGGCCGTTPQYIVALREALSPSKSSPSRQQVVN